ncbi:hypothetical protein HMP0721_2139 [Pseudoramibacter alactolyticus ATCC 23263]|uniref:Uncharacterized protein n=1 Tax=Pseudoramibacter alactolyticus ATCC 23263 TaxID=887929 RepID=E6MJF4_9FIRM|nr:hypothetical protein HMP0721_2139 [Pseudoramibacter alactolyticus ATCC 23263]
MGLVQDAHDVGFVGVVFLFLFFFNMIASQKGRPMAADEF